MSNVRTYTDQQILNKVRACPSFRGFPKGYWLVGVRSNEDAFNRFDDKFYCFKGDQFIATWKCTTNAGTDMLSPTNPRGEAVLKTGDIYYDSHERRLHRGKVMAYCQRRVLPLHRDGDRDRKTEELGTARLEIVGINIHPASYQIGSRAERLAIQGWSQGCQVFAIREDFDDFMDMTEGQPTLTYSLLPEWVPEDSPLAGLADDEVQLEVPRILEVPGAAPAEQAGAKPSEQSAAASNPAGAGHPGSSQEPPPEQAPVGDIPPAHDEAASTQEAANKSLIEKVESMVAPYLEKFDRVNSAATNITTRADSAKSLWTVVLGIFLQICLGVAKTFKAIPTEVWIATGAVVALFGLVYLLRQIVLGVIREFNSWKRR